ncbi:MAG: pilus assembly protein TadG-related protein, partial [Candidatus Sulfotelmatobacter sp.]
ISMVAIISMAALSIDLGTLYEAKAEAQRAADAAALAAAQVISISGLTGDTNGAADGSWADVCGGGSPYSSLVATNIAQQNPIGGVTIPSGSVTVTYSAGTGSPSADCSGAGSAFAVNPVVTVTVQSATLPIFFARVFSLLGGKYSGATVSATAVAEAFNPSNLGAAKTPDIIPVQPRCVKPLIIPNLDPDHTGSAFLNSDGTITTSGVKQLGAGVIGESFTLTADCRRGQSNCIGGNLRNNPPQVVTVAGSSELEYVPAAVQGTPIAVPACAVGSFQAAIAGCDQSTAYTCGTPSTASGATTINLDENPVNPSSDAGDTGTAVQCLINQANGQDSLDTSNFPFQIKAGAGSPLAQSKVVSSSDIITTSNSIVTLPIYDGTALGTPPNPPVTIVGFLQVFINDIDGNGHPNVTVLNVVGCGSNAGNPPLYGTSPVPVRLITPPVVTP